MSFILHRALPILMRGTQIIVMAAGRILESAMTSSIGSAHDTLLSIPTSAYSRLVSAQAFRDEVEEANADSDSIASDTGKPPVPVTLTRAEADELARNEKPAFETLKRTGTGRSAASVALSERRKMDLEGGRERPHSFFYLFKRMLQLNKARKWDYVAGVFASVVTGCVYPVFGEYRSSGEMSRMDTDAVMQVSSLEMSLESSRSRDLPSGTVEIDTLCTASSSPSSLPWVSPPFSFFAFKLLLTSRLGVMVQSYTFGSSSERLSRILRIESFAAILRQDVRPLLLSCSDRY